MKALFIIFSLAFEMTRYNELRLIGTSFKIYALNGFDVI